MDKGLLKSILVGIFAFIGGSIIAAQLGSAVTGFGSASRDSVALRNELAADIERTATELSQSQAILVEGLSPGARIVERCRKGTLPTVALYEPDATTVCPAGLIEELKEEQEATNEFAMSLAEAQSLARRVEDEIEEIDPARGWTAVVSGFEQLRDLETSNVCNEDRVERVELLRQPEAGDSVVDRSALLRATVRHVRDGDENKSTDPSSMVDTPIADALIGEEMSVPCDKHGNAFIPAWRRVRDVLVDESFEVARQVRRSHAELLHDKPSDVFRSLINPLYISAVAIALIAWILSRRIKVPEKPTLVKIVSEASQTDSDGGQLSSEASNTGPNTRSGPDDRNGGAPESSDCRERP